MRQFFSLLGHAILAFGFAILLAWTFPSLPSTVDPPSFPLRYIVSLSDTLAIVEQASEAEEWVVLNSERSRTFATDCKCPSTNPGQISLPQLERGANLEMLALQTSGNGQFKLTAQRDDLGGPEIAYAYRCDKNGIRPSLRYESFLGFAFPILGWRYFTMVIGIWLLVVLGIGRLRRRQH